MGRMNISGIAVVPSPDPVFLYKLVHAITSPSVLPEHPRYWLGGNLSTPVPIPSTDYREGTGSGQFATGWGRLSADRGRVLYVRLDSQIGTPGPNRITISAGPSPFGYGTTDDVAVAATNADNMFIGYPDWPDDNSIVSYAKDDGSGFGEVRTVLPDGTSDTLVYKRTTGQSLLAINLESVLMAPDGSKIAWVDQSEAVGGTTNRGVWIVNVDGTSPTLLQAWGSDFSTADRIVGWSHDSAFVAYTQTVGASVNTYKTNMSGTRTTLATGSFFRQQYDYQWLPDDSGVIVIRANVYGTQPRSVIAVAAADGSGVTDVSPERRIDTSGAITTPWNYPVVWDGDDRIYWYDLASISIVSVAADGSDFRTDHTLDATGADTTNDQLFRTVYTNG